MMKDALIQLLKTRTIDKITVYELCDTAQINRTTFYKYYGSPHELLKDIEHDFFCDLEIHLLEYNSNHDIALSRALSYIVDNQEKCRVLINSSHDHEFPERLFSLPAIRGIMDTALNKHFPESTAKYARTIFCYGGLSAIREWLNDGCKESIAEMTELLLNLSGSLMS